MTEGLPPTPIQTSVPTPRPVHDTEPQEVENFLETYEIQAIWIRFADAKAAAVLTVSGVLAGLICPYLKTYLATANETAHPTPWWTTLVLVIFIVWLVLQGGAAYLAFRCILPYRRGGSHPVLQHAKHFHGAAIGANYRIDDIEQFVEDCDKLTMNQFKREIAAAVLIDSHISNNKYKYVTLSIQVLGVAALFAFTFLLAAQF